MIKRSKPLVGAFLALASSLVLGQVPVIDRSGSAGKAPERQTPAAMPTPQPVQMTPQTSQLIELMMTVDQLQEELRFLRGQVEEQGHTIKQMRRDQRDRYRDLDRRISLLTQQPPTPAAALTPLPAPGVSVVDEERAVSTARASGVSDEQAYREAFAHVRQNAFDQALAAFAAFERNYAASALLGNVFYWTGEVHRAKPQPDQAQARLAYQRLLERFPDHAKAPDATYKLGLIYDAEGNRDKAQEVMQTVINRYPDQPPARLAREFISNN